MGLTAQGNLSYPALCTLVALLCGSTAQQGRVGAARVTVGMPPPVPAAVKEEVIAAAGPAALPPLVPTHVREQVRAASASGPVVPGSPGVHAEDPQQLIREKQRRRRQYFNCCSSARHDHRGRPGLSDRRTFSPGTKPPESPRSQVRGAMASKAKRSVILAYHSTSIDALFALLAAWLRHRGDSSVALRYLPLDPLDSLESRLQTVEHVMAQEACSLYLLGCSGSETFLRELSAHWPQCNLVSICSELPCERSTACMAWDHFDKEAQEAIGNSGGSGTGEALAQLADFGGDLGRLKLVFEYVEDHEMRRGILADSQAFASGLASLLQHELPWNPSAKNSTLFDVLLSLSPATLIENGKLVSVTVRRTLSGWGNEGT